jgi:hypothetical protein
LTIAMASEMYAHKADQLRPAAAPAFPSGSQVRARSAGRPGSLPSPVVGAHASRPWESAHVRSPGSAAAAASRPSSASHRDSGAGRSRPCVEQPSLVAAAGRPSRVRSGRYASAIKTSRASGLAAGDAELEPEPHQGIAVMRHRVVSGSRCHVASTVTLASSSSNHQSADWAPGRRCRICKKERHEIW